MLFSIAARKATMKRLAADIADTLAHAAAENERIWVLDGDLGDSYALYDETRQPRFPRFIQTGIAEQTLVATAAGLAACGQIPWVFSFSAFLCHRAADQIRTCVAGPQLPVILVGSHAGASTGANGSSHASLSDIGVLSSIGGIELWAPSDLIDVNTTIKSILTRPRPAYLRVSREAVPQLDLPGGDIRSNGTTGDIVLLSTGLASHWAREAVYELERLGITIPWTHIAKLDDQLLHSWIRSCPSMTHLIIIEDHGPVGGLSDAVRRVSVPGLKISAMTWPRDWHGEAGSIDALRTAYGLDTATIVRSIIASL